MKNYLKYVGYVAFFILGWLMSSHCSRQSCPPCLEVVSTKIDTVHTQSIDTVREVVVKKVPIVEYRQIIKVKKDTLSFPSYKYPELSVPQEVAYFNSNEYYQDSSYMVENNILYKGEIVGFDQAFHKLKDDYFRVEVRDTFTVKEVTIVQEPKKRILSVGPSILGDPSSIQGVGAVVSYMDRKRNSVDLGYYVYSNVWQASLKIPIWSR